MTIKTYSWSNPAKPEGIEYYKVTCAPPRDQVVDGCDIGYWSSIVKIGGEYGVVTGNLVQPARGREYFVPIADADRPMGDMVPRSGFDIEVIPESDPT